MQQMLNPLSLTITSHTIKQISYSFLYYGRCAVTEYVFYVCLKFSSRSLVKYFLKVWGWPTLLPPDIACSSHLFLPVPCQGRKTTNCIHIAYTPPRAWEIITTLHFHLQIFWKSSYLRIKLLPVYNVLWMFHSLSSVYKSQGYLIAWEYLCRLWNKTNSSVTNTGLNWLYSSD